MSNRTRATYPRAVVLPVLVVTVICLVALFWRPGGGPSPGDRVQGSVMGGESETRYAQLPYGPVRITMQHDDTVTVDDADRTLGGDEEWVEVTWQPIGSAQVAVWPSTDRRDLQEPTSRIILRAGGEDHVVADQVRSADGTGSVVIAVEDPKDLEVLVATADGSPRPTQSKPVRAGLQQSNARSVACRQERAGRAGFRPEVGCAFSATRATYVAGLGEAPKGKVWVVVADVRVQESYRVGEPMRVGTWWSEDHGRVDYVATGKPALRLTVTGSSRATETVGRDVLQTDDPRLATRAFLTADDTPVTVTMKYATDAVIASDEDETHGAPAKRKVAVEAIAKLPA